MKPLVLCILDGFGIRKEKQGNALAKANMPNYDKLVKEYPHSLLSASEEAVGLPHGQMGNSEVGHFNIGAGRVVYQPQEQINEEIKNGKFYENKNILDVIDYVKENKSKLHIFGLLSDGGIHSDIHHLMALIDMCKKNGIKEIYYHLFLDGRDTLPTEALSYIEQLEEKIKEVGFGKIATISGRYYAMDRDNRWDRVEKAYKVIIGEGKVTKDYKKYIKDSYEKNITDEFIEPILVNKEGKVEDKDGLIVFNYRPDRLRELFKALTNPNFNEFDHITFKNIKLVTMFGVSKEVICTNAYQKEPLENTLGVYLSKQNLKQLRIAETEKYAHVTYFFDGGKELELKGKDQILIPSPKVATYDLKPEMSAYEITDKLIEVMGNYDVIILNFANGDMVGHTGNFDATVQALEHLDVCLGKIYDKVEELKGTLVITADHGNCDTMIDQENREVTSHSMSKVPFIITNKNIRLKNGKLADIAPTILSLLKMPVPKEMTGENLIQKKNTKSNIFIIVSLLFLSFFTIFYSVRFIKYYKEEHPSTQTESNLSDVLKEQVVTTGSGLYYQNKEYIYKGQVENNYVNYSGFLFRIVKINEDNSIKLVTDTSIVNLKLKNHYKTSDIRNYLNDDGLEDTGIFYNQLIYPEMYLKSTSFCIQETLENHNCVEQINDKVGLLTYKEYVQALGNESYLNNGTYYWLMSTSAQNYYVFTEGGVSSETNGYYGIRPVITLKDNVKVVSGSGTKEDPYKIEKNNITVGSYMKYSDYLWKIIDIEEDGYKLALTELLEERSFSKTSNQYDANDKGSIAYYLNHDFYEKLNKNNLLEKDFYIGNYSDNYQSAYTDTVKSYVGLMSVTDNFINDFSNYYLLTPDTEDMVYAVGDNSKLIVSSIDELKKIRPVIYVSKNVVMTGSGTIADPYVVE